MTEPKRDEATCPYPAQCSSGPAPHTHKRRDQDECGACGVTWPHTQEECRAFRATRFRGNAVNDVLRGIAQSDAKAGELVASHIGPHSPVELQEDYESVTWWSTTRVNNDATAIGLAFNAGDGRVVRFRLSLSDARHIVETVAAELAEVGWPCRGLR